MISRHLSELLRLTLKRNWKSSNLWCNKASYWQISRNFTFFSRQTAFVDKRYTFSIIFIPRHVPQHRLSIKRPHLQKAINCSSQTWKEGEKKWKQITSFNSFILLNVSCIVASIRRVHFPYSALRLQNIFIKLLSYYEFKQKERTRRKSTGKRHIFYKNYKRNLSLQFSFWCFFSFGPKTLSIFIILSYTPQNGRNIFSWWKVGERGSLSHLTTLQKLSRLSKWTATSSLV